MIGSNTDLGMCVAIKAPMAAPTSATAAIGAAARIASGSRRRYVSMAAVVPMIELHLFVPRIAAVGALGRPINNAGNWMSPPPPAMASTNPAAKAANAKKAMVVADTG